MVTRANVPRGAGGAYLLLTLHSDIELGINEKPDARGDPKWGMDVCCPIGRLS